MFGLVLKPPTETRQTVATNEKGTGPSRKGKDPVNRWEINLSSGLVTKTPERGSSPRGSRGRIETQCIYNSLTLNP